MGAEDKVSRGSDALVSGVRPHVCVSLLPPFFLLYLPENCFDSADPDLSGHVRVGHLTCATPRMCDSEVSVVFEDGAPEPVEVAAGQRERERERERMTWEVVIKP